MIVFAPEFSKSIVALFEMTHADLSWEEVFGGPNINDQSHVQNWSNHLHI
jgi:hypothetical protein